MPTQEENKLSKNIFDCIKEANVDELESVIKRGAGVNELEKSKDKFTPLHSAAYYGSLECLHWLLWNGADPSITTPKGWTAAHVSAIRGQYSCIQALIKNGVNMNARDHRGQTPAHLAATHGHSHTLQAIIRSGADINLADSNGWTPVHVAAYHGRLGCLQFLKTAGGRMDDCDNDGNTPAHLAAMEGNLHCLKYILCNSPNSSSLISARNDQGDTPKTLAQQFYKDEVVQYLEAVEWDRDHPEQAENLAFPAHVAAFNGDLDHIKLLIEQGVININERDDKGATMAHKAAGQGNIHVLQWLIENGIDLKIANNSGETAQDIASRFGQLAAVKLLDSECGTDHSSQSDRADFNYHSESKEAIVLNSDQKKGAKERAKKRLEEMEKQLVIAKSNYIQLGGRLEEISTNQNYADEQKTIKEHERTIHELESELEVERIRREKLELQLDNCRQELERTLKSLRDYETKVVVLERFLQHSAKQEVKAKRKQGTGAGDAPTSASRPASKNTRSRSQQSKNREDSGAKSTGSTKKKSTATANSKLSNYSESSFRPHKRQDILDTLSSSQLKELRRAFENIDKNNSGSISYKELKQAFNYLDVRASDDEIQVVINQMDTNDDGRIEFEEFARVMARNYYKKHTREEIIEAFRKFDINDSGYISAEELRAVLSKKYRFISREEIDDLIKKADANKDGLISIQEFANYLNLD